MNLILKFEKTIFFMIKILIIFSIFIIFFSIFSIKIPQLKTINRTSIISFVIFFVAILNLIKIFGGFKIETTHIQEIKNSIILGTIVTDLITFLVTFFMGISSMHYYEFYNNFSDSFNLQTKFEKPNFSTFLKHYFSDKIMPSILILMFIILVQIIIIQISINLTYKLYYKLNPPQKTIIIYGNKNDLIFLVSKIKKNSSMWNLTNFVKFDSKDVFKIIKKSNTIFFTNIPKQNRSILLKFCYRLNKTTHIYPDIADVLLYSSMKLMVDDSMVFSSNNFDMSFEQMFFKRIIDIIFSLIILVLTSPIMIVTALLIKICDGGPVFFKQKRLTQNEKEFYLLKFRSMKLNAEQNTGAVLAKENDARITFIGKFLRRFRIDELPQLFNIFKGELSLVGPRPERKEYVKKIEQKLPEFKYRLKVKAGLTGLAQISGKYNTTPKDKLALDLSYIQKYSLWLDIKIILRTLIVFIKTDSTEGEKLMNKKIIDFVNKKIQK